MDVFEGRVPYLDAGPALRGAIDRIPTKAGARPAILASTIYLMGRARCSRVPLGVGTAIYLEEYAGPQPLVQPPPRGQHPEPRGGPVDRLRILGLAFLVRVIGLGRVLLAGALILTLLVLPIRDHRRPRGDPGRARLDPAGRLRARGDEVAGGLAPGAPAAIPGIATGTILALSRASDQETAPLLLVGAVGFVGFNPTLLGSFTALPIQIFQWIARPQDEFKALAAAAIIVLLVILPRPERRRDLAAQPLSAEMVTR